MIELLILYILNKRDRTLYSLRRDIIEKFGMITKPSLGTMHPAMQRLLKKDAVKMDKKFSEGGKKSTYYSITNNAKAVFKELFFEDISLNPTIFHNQLSVRLLTISMLEKEDREIFLQDLIQVIELQKIEAQNALNDEYVKYDEYQKVVLEETLSNLKSLISMVERLKAN